MATANAKRKKRATSTTKVLTSSSNIRFKQPDSKDRRPKQTNLTALAPVDLAGGFVDFIRNHAIIALAVGFVIATQVQALVKQLVSSFITPTFQFFFNNALANDNLTLHLNNHVVVYSWGVFITDLLDFLFVLVALYLIIRFFKLDKLDKPKETKK
ncbi:MAG TPA: MscL family protein [Candidatus Saccharimonadales bacterium]